RAQTKAHHPTLPTRPNPAERLSMAVDPLTLNAAPNAPDPPVSSLNEPGDLRLTSPGIRLAQVKEKLVAWLKTLVSAAVYAILIGTFGFQVARVEGQSMAPTLEDQDRLIVNKLVYRIG